MILLWETKTLEGNVSGNDIDFSLIFFISHPVFDIHNRARLNSDSRRKILYWRVKHFLTKATLYPMFEPELLIKDPMFEPELLIKDEWVLTHIKTRLNSDSRQKISYWRIKYFLTKITHTQLGSNSKFLIKNNEYYHFTIISTYVFLPLILYSCG